jgi:S-adenosylmethionine-diacylglycerol 3-amino-3-carboxypropyl transferase
MRRATSAGLKAAVHRSKPLSRAGVLERLFTLAFERLVYPQIWEARWSTWPPSTSGQGMR